MNKKTCLQHVVGGIGVCLIAFAPSVFASAVCAMVKIEIQQTLTLERQAFDATMKIHNGFTELPLEAVDIEVLFTDADENSIPATTNPNDTNALFFIRVDSLSNIDAATNGTIAAGQSAEIHWLIIPALGASGTNTAGQLYYVGATLNYRLQGQDLTVDVTPDWITVQPMPRLTLDYFLPAQVYGDDPFTTTIEPPVPYSLGLRILNTGHGPATAVKMESAQPEIVQNDLGLLLGYTILGTEVNGAGAARTLTADFGAIGAGEAGLARWTMETTLMGEFTEFAADISHSDALGGRLTSLIQEVQTHTLVRDVWVDLPGRDAILDLLGKDDTGLTVYESDAIDSAVTNWTGQGSLTRVQGGAGDHLYDAVVPLNAGPFYAEWSYTNGATRDVRTVVRADGKVLKAANAWIEQRRERGTDPWEYYFCLFDTDQGGAYQVTFQPRTVQPNQMPVLHFIGRQVVGEGEALGFIVQASDPDGTLPVLSALALPAGATFTNLGTGEGEFTWATQAGDYGVHPVRFIASDGEIEDWEIVRIYVGRPGEPLTNGLPESLADWAPEIMDVWASSMESEATVLWNSIDGLLYEVYAADNPFAALSAWTRVGHPLAGNGELLDMTEGTGMEDIDRRYYRLVLAGDPPDERNTWALVRKEVMPGYTLMAPPVRSDRRFDGEMGAALAEMLQGANGGIGSGGDEIYLLQPNASWVILYLNAAGKWCEANGTASSRALPPGQGFWVARHAGTSARLTFAGPVGNDGSQSVALQPGFNLIGLSEGRDLPLTATLATANPQGGTWEEVADQIVIQNPDGSWRRLMYVTNWGPAYDGHWFDFSTWQIVPTNEVIPPGAAFYYLRRGAATEVEF